MTAIAFSLSGQAEATEDIAQETFAIACRDIGRLSHPDKFAAWLAGICRNTARKYLRTRKEKRLSDDYLHLQSDDPTTMDPETRTLIRQAVWSLPEKLRETIILRYYDGLSYEQIARINALTVQGVNGRILRAKKKIVSCLKKKGLHHDIL
jgi:RNA polymerase sigma-70 factor (ECF subfamily)